MYVWNLINWHGWINGSFTIKNLTSKLSKPKQNRFKEKIIIY